MKRRFEYIFDVEREALWRYVADTDWINRHSGLPALTARVEAQRDGSTKRYARFWGGPFTNEWEELPTLWRAPEYYEVERRYTRGLLRRFVNRTTLESLGPKRTKLVFELELVARNALTRAVLPLVMARGMVGSNRAFALAAKLAAGSQPDHPRGSHRFGRLVARGISSGAIDALDRLMDEGEEAELATIRPYELADRYGIGRREMLRACLAATRDGLLNLRWDVICPGCRGNANTFDSLAEMRGDLHCANCNVPYGPQFDRSVEVTFNARPLGRGIDVPLYCIASPQASSHVLAQIALDPGGRGTVSAHLEVGTYDINAVGVALTPFIAESVGAEATIEAIVADGRIDFPHTIAAGRTEVRLVNTLERPTIIRIENGRWPDTIATAAAVTALQEFRDMFSSEVLAPGLELGVESMAILFTDLLGSTAMYSKAGDAPAFRIVTDHFARLRPIIEAGEGAIVKTIGDAVMAVFSSPARCLEAALAMDAAVRDLEHDGAPLRLRVGFALGPCIAMRANEKIDYFGTTVNLAARLEAKAGGGEVTMTRSAADRDDVRDVLRASGRTTTIETLPIKGFESSVEVVRVLA